LARRLVVALVIVVVVVASALVIRSAESATYYSSAYDNCLPPNAGASSNGWARLTYNWVEWDYCHSYAQNYVCTRYYRTDGTGTPWACGPYTTGYVEDGLGSFYDARDIAYGRAICLASWNNTISLFVYWCDTNRA
jgi:hypothetical protein